MSKEEKIKLFKEIVLDVCEYVKEYDIDKILNLSARRVITWHTRVVKYNTPNENHRQIQSLLAMQICQISNMFKEKTDTMTEISDILPWYDKSLKKERTVQIQKNIKEQLDRTDDIVEIKKMHPNNRSVTQRFLLKKHGLDPNKMFNN